MPTSSQSRQVAIGALLVFASALTWSFGGAFARSIAEPDRWAVIFWRSVWAFAFLLTFMLVRDGIAGTRRQFAAMGWPGVSVGLCFTTASVLFVIALTYTTVANVLLIDASVPLIAAVAAWLLFGEKPSAATWIAIAVVIVGVAIMVSESLDGGASVIGNILAIIIALAFAAATVITRRFAHVPMMPAACLGAFAAAAIAATQAGTFAVSGRDMAFLFAFGALNLGLGMAFFMAGARLVPASFAALIGTSEPVMGPLWVWLTHGETPSMRTLAGGAVVMAALVSHILWQMRPRAAAKT